MTTNNTPRKFLVFSGNALSITATSEEEALAKYNARNNWEPCPCGDGDEFCICITEAECMTHVEEA